MKKFKFKPLVLAIGLSVITNMVQAELKTNRAVINNNGTDRVHATANFVTPVTGDLYIAVEYNGQLIFITDEGKKFSDDVLPFSEKQVHEGVVELIDYSAAGIPAGRYRLYQVVAGSGLDPLNFNNWIGGLGGLNSINFNIGLPAEVTQDLDNDGFSDDDLNEDGFHDDDLDRNGFHDDDLDRNGFHDDDLDRNGSHDDDLDRNGSHDNDLDRNGSHDDDLDRNGSHDDDMDEDSTEEDDDIDDQG